MKNLIVARVLLLPLVLSIFVASCHDPVHRSCRIDQFFWEDEWHQAHYNHVGRLTKLIADSSKIYFQYDGTFQLSKAEIYTTGATPTYRFEFTHGPWGIVEINEYNALSGFRYRIRMHYASPMRVDTVVREDYAPGSISPDFIGTYNLIYTSGNVTSVEATSTGIGSVYNAFKYDKKKNPFRTLAAAVGNPLFFPACVFVSFPVTKYDISFLAVFSDHNPLQAAYQLPDTDRDVQTFTNTYSGPLVEKIVWTSVDYLTSEEDYAFQFECGRRHDDDE